MLFIRWGLSTGGQGEEAVRCSQSEIRVIHWESLLEERERGRQVEKV